MLAVGDSTRLEIIFDTKQARSRVAKSPVIETNEGKPDKKVTIDAIVTDRPDSTFPIILRPYKLDLTQTGNNVRKQIKFTIENVSDQELTLTLVSVPEEFAGVSIPKTVKPGKTAEGTLTLTPKGIESDFTKSFTIELGDEGKTRFTMPVKRTIRKLGEISTPVQVPGGH